MAVIGGRARLEDTALAFDRVAGEYDRSNRQNPILAEMRARVIGTLRRHVPAGAEILDAGCGPGTDHPALLAAGYHVTAVDRSPGMVAQARQRAGAHGPGAWEGSRRPTIVCASLDDLGALPREGFDAVLSNFGALNCVPDLAETSRQLRGVLRPRGLLVASVIGRICPWEIALYLARGRVARAFTRFRPGSIAVPLRGGTVWTQYWTPAAFERVFASAGFVRRELRTLALASPPPYLESFARRRPSLVGALRRLDDVAGGWPLVRAVGDHFLIVMQRT